MTNTLPDFTNSPALTCNLEPYGTLYEILSLPLLSIGTTITVGDGSRVKAGDVLAKIPKDVTRTKDITGGLPRISELFEVRYPRNPAVLSEIDGHVEVGKEYKNKRRIKIVSDEDGSKYVEYLISKGKSILVREGDIVKKGDVIVDGNLVLQDVLRILGVEAMTVQFVDEVQKVYRLQGIPINDKHVEVIVRQMLSKREIIDAGDSIYINGEEIDKDELEEANAKLLSEGKKQIIASTIIEGITKAALKTKSFISAASFQETTRVLTEAAMCCKVDKLVGLKENVIVGRLMPAGTGSVVNRWRLESQKQQVQTQESIA